MSIFKRAVKAPTTIPVPEVNKRLFNLACEAYSTYILTNGIYERLLREEGVSLTMANNMREKAYRCYDAYTSTLKACEVAERCYSESQGKALYTELFELDRMVKDAYAGCEKVGDK